MKRKAAQKEKKKNPPPYKTAIEERINEPRRMLYASFPKKAGDSLVAETRTHNASSPAFKKRVISRLPVVPAKAASNNNGAKDLSNGNLEMTRFLKAGEDAL